MVVMMFNFKRKLRLSAAASTAVVCCALLSATAQPVLADDDAPPSGYPSWADVQAAKQNSQSKAAEVDKITKLIAQLDKRAKELGAQAVTANQKYSVAQDALETATQRTGVLKQQAQNAQAQAEQSSTNAGNLAAQIYKGGGTELGVFSSVTDLQSPERLQAAGLVSVMTDGMSNVLIKAKESKQVADALSAQQKQAEEEQSRLTKASQDALAQAQSAQKTADTELSSQQKNSQTLKAQLASLNDTEQKTEVLYQQGVEAQRQYEAVQAAKAAAAEKLRQEQEAAARAAAEEAARRGAIDPPDPGGGGSPGPVVPPPVIVPPVPGGGGAINDPAGAQAYAAANLGVFGWGQDQFGCLVSLWNRESSWLTNATNPSSGAYGVPQSLPAEKMADAGPDWLTNYQTQINWGLNYIRGRYGSPCGAWGHSQATGWY